MKNIYYVVKAGEVQGPVSPQELEILYREGQISASTQICEEGSDNWKPYGEAGGAVTDSSKSQAIKTSESKSSSKTTQTEQPSTNKAKFKGITQWQGTLLIFLIFIGIGTQFWVLLKPMPITKYDYTSVAILAESGPIYDENLKKLFTKRISTEKINSTLLEMKVQGWELVDSFLEHETSHPNFGKEDYVTGIQPNIRPSRLVLIFKRSYLSFNKN